MPVEASELIQTLWPRFRSEQIRAVIPRNYDELPEQVCGDLDIFVHPRDLRRARELARDVADRAGWRVLFDVRTANHYQTVFWCPGDRQQRPRSLHLDLQNSLGRKGLRYAPVQPFLESPRILNGFSVPRPPAAAVGLALHTVLDKGTVREDYGNALRKADPSAVETFAEEVLPRSVARRLTKWVRDGAPESAVQELAGRLRRTLVLKRPRNVVLPLLIRLRRLLAWLGPRRGVLVAFLGPDGAGKSTLIEAVERAVPSGPYPVRSVYLGKRDPYLPTSHLIRWISNLQERRAARKSSPPRRRSRGLRYRLRDVAGLINWICEQWARYLIHARPHLQLGGVVLTDRCAFDFGNREDESWAHRPWFRRLFPFVFPMPDRTYLLWEDPEVLYARKGELEPERGAAFLERFRSIIRHVPNSREIRTNEPVEDIAARIAHEIASCLEARWDR